MICAHQDLLAPHCPSNPNSPLAPHDDPHLDWMDVPQAEQFLSELAEEVDHEEDRAVLDVTDKLEDRLLKLKKKVDGHILTKASFEIFGGEAEGMISHTATSCLHVHYLQITSFS